jgi:hypothetical protein
MPVQQHPLPQDISSYKFRLIGDMTVKQFGYIAGFIILTVLLHQSPIPFFFRYPLEIFSLGLGIGLAFVPVQGRPLDKWIIAFIKSIYSPTQYVWKQEKQDLFKTTSQKKLDSPPTSTSSSTPLTTSTTVLDLSPPSSSPNLPAASPRRKASRSSNVKLSTNRQSVSLAKKKLDEAKVKPSSPKVSPTSTPALDKKLTSSSTKAPPSTNLPIPFTPDRENTIVGLTLTPQGNILENVLIEIVSNGLTIRATKSNKLGQFLFAKALEDGLYQIKAEKEGFQFTTYSISLQSRILKPLKIQAKS